MAHGANVRRWRRVPQHRLGRSVDRRGARDVDPFSVALNLRSKGPRWRVARWHSTPAERNTQQIFNALFGVEKDSKETIRRRLSRRGSILDGVSEDAQRVTKQLGSEDRNKSMSTSRPCVRSKNARNGPTSGSTSRSRPCHRPTPRGLQRKLTMAEAGEYYRLFYDLMALALQTDSTRVITCGIGGEGHASGIPEIGILQTATDQPSQRRSRATASPDGHRHLPGRAVQLFPRLAQAA